MNKFKHQLLASICLAPSAACGGGNGSIASTPTPRLGWRRQTGRLPGLSPRRPSTPLDHDDHNLHRARRCPFKCHY